MHPIEDLLSQPRYWRPAPLRARFGESKGGGLRTGTRQPVVLAVDDENDSLEFLRELFEQEGFRFVRASSGPEALTLVAAQRPDALIVDYMMPGMTGLELCELVRSDASLRNIPIIIYTAYNIRPQSYLGNYDLVFQKPVDPETLLRAVRSLLKPEGAR